MRACLSWSDPFVDEIEFQMVSIGDVVYATDSQTGAWEISESSETLVAALDDALDFTGDDFINDIRELTVEGVEILDDVSVYRVTGVLTAAALGDATLFRVLDPGGQGELQVAYWVGVSDSLVRKFTAGGRLALEEGEMINFSMVVEVSDFGEEVVIEVPEVNGTPDTATR